MKVVLTRLIDLFYPVFRPFLDLQTYRFLACGGINVLIDIFMFFICFHFVVQKQIIYLPFNLAISPYIAALILSFCLSVPLTFMVMRNIAFPGSELRGRTQLIRYIMVVLTNLMVNYIVIKLLVEQLAFYPTIAKVFATAVVVVVSYLLQRNFAFKTRG